MKRFVLSMVAISVAMLAAAQWSVAPKAGVNWSKVNFPESYGGNPSSLTGFHAGVAATYQINKWLDVQGEVLYTMRGLDWDDLYVADDAGNISENGVKVRQHYLDIPVLLKFFPCTGFNLQAGPQLGVPLKYDGGLAVADGDKVPVDFGLVFGLGYESGMGVFVDARYTLGLTSTVKDMPGWQNRTIGLTVGYRFYLK